MRLLLKVKSTAHCPRIGQLDPKDREGWDSLTKTLVKLQCEKTGNKHCLNKHVDVVYSVEGTMS